VSIGHRPALESFHQRTWVLKKSAPGDAAAYLLRQA
jgi:hypothetical protein